MPDLRTAVAPWPERRGRLGEGVPVAELSGEEGGKDAGATGIPFWGSSAAEGDGVELAAAAW